MNFLTTVWGWLEGKKTYFGLAVGAAIVVANHFGVLPPELTPSQLDANAWVQNLYTLALGGTIRNAIGTPKQQTPTK